jgi:anthranilate synthase/aminodeoxychorismate synthase-like glutamine amidotransferase
MQVKVLLIDNYDSFTHILKDYILELGAEVLVVQSDKNPMEVYEEYKPNKVMLSPGPGTPSQAGDLMKFIAKYYLSVPMLGVCLGHQALGEFFGCKLQKAAYPMHGKVSTIHVVQESILFAKIPIAFNACRYHSLLLSDLTSEIVPLAYTSAQELMAFKHISLPLYGIQFHPEAYLTENGKQILSNWLVSSPI